MSDIQHIDVDSEDYESAPKALRDHVKRLQKAHTDLQQTTSDLRGQLNSRALGDALAGKSFKNPKRVERDLLSDKVDPLDVNAVEAWLNENAADYALVASEGEPNPEGSEQQPDPDAEAYGRIGRTTGGDPSSLTRLEAATAKITPEMTGEDVAKLFAAEGV